MRKGLFRVAEKNVVKSLSQCNVQMVHGCIQGELEGDGRSISLLAARTIVIVCTVVPTYVPKVICTTIGNEKQSLKLLLLIVGSWLRSLDMIPRQQLLLQISSEIFKESSG